MDGIVKDGTEIAVEIHMQDYHQRQLPSCFDKREDVTWAQVHELLHNKLDQNHELGYR